MGQLGLPPGPGPGPRAAGVGRAGRAVKTGAREIRTNSVAKDRVLLPALIPGGPQVTVGQAWGFGNSISQGPRCNNQE
jgi:hypothetical protein